jgi:predicted amidohydrolase
MVTAAPRTVRVGLAQLDSRLGDLAANLERHLAWIARAREAGVDLLLFPELSLTGYRLHHLAARVALRPAEAPEIARLAAACKDLTAVVGLVEEHPHGGLCNSAVALAGGRIAGIHRKLQLPTYGLFQEARCFRAGDRLDLLPVAGTTAGLLICEELWHPGLARRLARGGADLIAVLSAGPGRLGAAPEPASQGDWELLTRATALVDTCWVLFCGRVGWEEGCFYPGGSHVVRPGGEIVSRAPWLEEHLLVADLDLAEVTRLRTRLPLLADERQGIEGP